MSYQLLSIAILFKRFFIIILQILVFKKINVNQNPNYPIRFELKRYLIVFY